VYRAVMTGRPKCISGNMTALVRPPFFFGSRKSCFVVLTMGFVSFATELVLGAGDVVSLAEADDVDELVAGAAKVELDGTCVSLLAWTTLVVTT